MARVTIQHGCGHDRVIETPGPEDPEGLLGRIAQQRGAVHRAPASKCPECEGAQPVRFGVDALPRGDEAALPSAADLDAVAAEQDLQTAVKRVLLVDDEQHRADSIAAILPNGVSLRHATGQPGIEELLHDHKYDGLLLDHDLYDPSGRTGEDVARIVAETQNPETCKIFIHSQNMGGAMRMAEILVAFQVSRIPWDNAEAIAPGMYDWLRAL